MPDVDDIALLREYVDSHAESAFAVIVQRRVNLVYSVALRFTGNSEDAQDVTQAVFVILAKKASGLRPNTILTGWLYETTRFAAMNFLTQKNRRQAREQEAYMQASANDTHAEASWLQLAPLLESAMSRLNGKDRTLVALRFFENRSIAETAALLDIKESAARKRAQRVIEKLRAYYSNRGINSSAEAIAGAISASSIQIAPAGLAATVTAAAKGAAVSTSTLTLVKGALKIMAWTKMKTTAVAATVLIFTATTTTVVIKHYSGHSRGKLPLTPANLALFQRESDKLGRDAKMASLACMLFAGDHTNQLPTSFAQLNAWQQQTTLSDKDWEFATGGNKDGFSNPDTTIYYLEKEPRQSPDGKFTRIYVTVNGRLFVLTSSNEDFTAAEKKRGFLIQQAKN